MGPGPGPMGPLVRAKKMPFGPGKKNGARLRRSGPYRERHFFLPRPKGIFFARTKGPMGPGPGPMASCSVLLYYYAFILYYYIILYIILYIF